MMKKIMLILVLLSLIAIFLAGLSSALTISGTIAYWKFDETTGTNIKDYALGINNGTIKNPNQLNQNGLFSTALKINGSTQNNMTVNMSQSLNFTNTNFSISFWINASADNFGGVTFDKRSVNNPNSITMRYVNNETGLSHKFQFDDASDADIIVNGSQSDLKTGIFQNVIVVYNNKNLTLFLNGTWISSTPYTTQLGANEESLKFKCESSPCNTGYIIDEMYIFNKSLNSSEINTLYTNTVPANTQITTTLNSPINNTVSTSSVITFNATLSSTAFNLTNATIFVINSSNAIINQTKNIITGNASNNSIWNINFSTFPVGTYKWNVLGCAGNSSISNCSMSPNNFTFDLAASILSESFNISTYETASETFGISINLFVGTDLSLGQLVYNGTNYTVSNITSVNNTRILTRTIDIPLNALPFANQTDSFFWRFTFSNAQQTVQTTAPENQNVGFINYQLCNSTYAVQALNFSLYDEINQIKLVPNTNETTSFESNWKYWLGSGDVYKNYSFQLLNSSTNSSYQFCIYPYVPSNYTFGTDGDIEYSAQDYRENQYHLRNATLTSTSNNILLYLIHQDFATKFFLTFKQGTEAITDATITVQKFFTGLGQFITTGILQTDDTGQATMWQEIDKNYKYSIVKNGQLIGTVEKTSICSAAPCSLTIQISSDAPNVTAPFYDVYAQNVLSSLTYNKTTHIVTYEFIDITGLAEYFRLLVTEINLNQTGATICDTQSFSTAGTITCNLTGQTGEFVATGFISRSPELTDKILNILTDDSTLASLGLLAIFLDMAIIITMVMAGAVVGKGSPSTILGFLGFTILGLKLIGIFAFTWTVTSTLEFLILLLIWRIES